MVVVDIVDGAGAGAGGVGAVRGGNLSKNKKAGGGLGGRAQRLPPRCIADDHDGGLFFEPVVVPASGCFSGPASSRWNTITIAFVAGKEVFLLLL